ncbi:hypothetical protein GGTG_10984 [Gaeumannomyces tritici R3-111a-1]|uniref:Uncharacterized protein n=1 Tax=Gaeumannomyces tritici (strain R3-111a-1) TaxID=644352 RepID=J3PBW2_GAET3|nr:hypothetical protein GGTG_10984 [Gaeumannomyces tritici R3-111a-1]EJT71730.1 hypothetical protein GGTG_10984 [Gaeumannomyces tritici R3-111a-1]
MPASYRYCGQSIMAKLKNKVKFKLYESVWSAKNLKNRPRVPERARKKGSNVIGAYRYTGVNGIVLICLTTKIASIKHYTLRIIIFKKGQTNRVIFIILLGINNFLQRERVANTHVKQRKSGICFGGRFIGSESFAAALVARFTLFFSGGLFAAAVKARRGVISETFVGSLKGCKRKKGRWTRNI